MKGKPIKNKTQLNRRDKQGLRIAGVQFKPTPGVEQRLVRVFDLLLSSATGKSHVAMEEEAVSGEESED